MIFGIYTHNSAKKYYIPLNLHEIVINESSLDVNWKHKKVTTQPKNIYFLKVYSNDHLKLYKVCKFGKKKTSEVFGSHTRPKSLKASLFIDHKMVQAENRRSGASH